MAQVVTDGSVYGGGTGNVILDNVRCSGTETTLFGCSHGRWGVVADYCNDHSRDAAVVCSDGERENALFGQREN